MDKRINMGMACPDHYWARLKMDWEPHPIDVQDEILHSQILDNYPNQQQLVDYYESYSNQTRSLGHLPVVRTQEVQGSGKRSLGNNISIHPNVSQDKRRLIFADMINGPPSLRSLNHSVIDDEASSISSPSVNSAHSSGRFHDFHDTICDALSNYLFHHPERARWNSYDDSTQEDNTYDSEEELFKENVTIAIDTDYESETEDATDWEPQSNDDQDEILHSQILSNYHDQKAMEAYCKNYSNQTRSLANLDNSSHGIQGGQTETSAYYEKRRRIFTEMMDGPPSLRSLDHSVDEAPRPPSPPAESDERICKSFNAVCDILNVFLARHPERARSHSTSSGNWAQHEYSEYNSEEELRIFEENEAKANTAMVRPNGPEFKTEDIIDNLCQCLNLLSIRSPSSVRQ